MPRIAAFFDMDRTILSVNTATRWIAFLRRRKEISLGKTLQAAGWILRYKLALLDMEAVTTIATRDYTGQEEASMLDKCRLFFDEEVVPAITARAIEAIARHRAEGHVLAILSSSTPYVTEPLARKLAIDHVLCTRFHIEDGKFVGTHVKPACYGAGKVHWAEQFAAANDVDLAASFFYTDSYSDLPMLERVGVPRVVNADTRLRRLAQKRGWPMEDW